jgi:hypothetical protein
MPRAWAIDVTLAKEALGARSLRMRLTVGSETPLRWASAAWLMPRAWRRALRRSGMVGAGAIMGSYLIRTQWYIGSLMILL